MKYCDEIDIKIILDKLRLLTDGVTQLNKRYSQWSDLDVVQLAFPIVTYTTELLEILNREDTDIRLRNEHEEQGQCL